MTHLLSIFSEVILPILVLVALGAAFHYRFRINLETINRLTIYLLVPSFLFVKIHQSTLSLMDIWHITYGVFVPVLVMAAAMYILLRTSSVDGNVLAAMIVASVVFNAGNFGLPVAELYYSRLAASDQLLGGMSSANDGVAVQALIIMLSNVSVWLFGYGVIRVGQGHGLRGVLGFFRLPMIYVVVAAFSLRGVDLPTAIDQPLNWLATATVPIMLLTLGAQLAHDAHWPNWKHVGPVLILKLLALPALTAAFVWLFDLWPWPGAQIIIASSAPTAVNTLVLSIELKGDSRLAANCVFWTTLVSAVTVTCILAVVGWLAS